MAKVEDALRDLVSYHGRKAAREVLGKLPAAVREVRRELKDLRFALKELQKDVGQLLERKRAETATAPAPPEEVKQGKVTKQTILALRKKLDLTQGKLAKLLDVSPASIASWEGGKSKPKRRNIARIISLRDKARGQVAEAPGQKEEAPPAGTENLKALRAKLGLTQGQFAKALGVSSSSVTNWEAGRSKPRAANLEAIAKLQGSGKPKKRTKPAAKKTKAQEALSPAAIKRMRQKLGFSQRALAARLKVSTSSVSNWEAGRTSPSERNIAGLRALSESKGKAK